MKNNNWLYSDKLKEHFMHPKNVLDDDIINYDGKGVVGNIKCGDEMIVVIKVDKKNNIITDCKWKTYGCASAIASTSVLSEIVKGKTLEEAYKITPKDIKEELGGLPEHKVHCSVLGDKALRAAIDDYCERNGIKCKIKKEQSKIICQCMNVTDKEIEDAVLDGVRTYYQLQEKTKLGTVCGRCKDEAIIVLDEYVEKYFNK